MSEERPELSRKGRISGKLFQTIDNAKSVWMKVPERLWHWSCVSEIIIFFILKFSLSFT